MEEQTNQNTEAPKEEAPKADGRKEDIVSDAKGLLSQLETILEEYLVKKAPFAIPIKGKELIVKIAPYIVIIFAIMAVPVLLAALGLSAIFAPIAFLGGFGAVAFLSVIFAAVSLVIEIIAIPGLFARTRRGWKFAFYASIVNLVRSIASFNIIGGIIGAIIGWYILFQVKELYKNS